MSRIPLNGSGPCGIISQIRKGRYQHRNLPSFTLRRGDRNVGFPHKPIFSSRSKSSEHHSTTTESHGSCALPPSTLKIHLSRTIARAHLPHLSRCGVNVVPSALPQVHGVWDRAGVLGGQVPDLRILTHIGSSALKSRTSASASPESDTF